MTNPNWPTVSVAIQFSGTTWTDITSLVRNVQCHRGRQYELSRASAGSLTLELDNHAGNFDPANTSSIYYPNVTLYRPIRVQTTWASVTKTIWQGFVERWPQNYLSQGNWQMTPLQATDILGVLKQKVFLSGGEEKIAQQNPTYWWPLSASTGNSTVVQERQTGVQNGYIATFGGNPAVTLGTNPFRTQALGLEGSGGAVFKPDKAGYGFASDMSVIRLLKPLDGGFFPWPAVPWTLSFLIQTTTRPSTDANYNPAWFIEWTDSGGGNGTGKREFIRFGISQRGLFYVRIRDANAAIVDEELSTNLADGLPHLISIEFSGTGSNNRFYYTADGQGIANLTSGNVNGWTFDQIVAMNVGGSYTTNSAANSGYAGLVSEVAWYGGQHLVTDGTGGNSPGYGPFTGSAANPDSLPSVILNAWNGQTSDQRIQSIMTLAGFPTSFVASGTGQATLQGAVLNGVDAATAVQDVATTEGGVLFVRGDGNLAFSTRAFRYGPTAAATIGDGTSYPVSQLSMSFDTQQVVTQSEIDRRNGNSCISTNTAQVAALGLFTNQISNSQENTDNQCFAHAQYITGWFGAPTTRIQKLGMDLGANPTAFSLIGSGVLEIDTCIQVNHTPLGGHAVSLLLYIESVKYDISPDRFTVEMDAVPADTRPWLKCDTSGKNLLDSSTLKLSF